MVHEKNSLRIAANCYSWCISILCKTWHANTTVANLLALIGLKLGQNTARGSTRNRPKKRKRIVLHSPDLGLLEENKKSKRQESTQRAVIARHFAVGAASVECHTTYSTSIIVRVPGPRCNSMPSAQPQSRYCLQMRHRLTCFLTSFRSNLIQSIYEVLLR